MDSRSDSPSWLSELLTPVSVNDFLSTYWRTRPLFCRGRSDRFAGLLSWPALNTILEHHWRETFRFRLALQGRDLDPASYADLAGYTPRIRARDVTDHLRRGATLSFDAIDEVHEPLTRLAEQFEGFFRGGTKINIYAGWRALHGLDLHRDNQEIFILQLDGRKRWLLYGFSVDGIDRGDLSRTSVPPPGAESDRVLEPGDLLYIPRGCYHLAVPMDEPTLHLTLGVKNPRGRDVWRWLIDRVDATGLADADLPLLADRGARIDFSERLRSALVDGLDADLVEQYVAEAGSNFKPRPSFSLPWSATGERLPPERDFRVRLHVDRLAPGHVSADGSFELRSAGRTYRFPRGMQAVVERLAEGSPMAMGALSAAVAGEMDETMVRLLVGMLVKENLVSILT